MTEDLIQLGLIVVLGIALLLHLRDHRRDRNG